MACDAAITSFPFPSAVFYAEQALDFWAILFAMSPCSVIQSNDIYI